MSKLPASLQPFRDSVCTTRAAYLKRLRALPPPLSTRAIQLFQHRARRACPRPLLGEFAPWLIADLLNVSDSAAVRRVATAWLSVYLFTLILDDTIDRGEDTNPHDLIVSALLLQRGLTDLLSQADKPSRLRRAIDLRFTQTALAAVQELVAHRRRITSFSPPQLQFVGQKVALLHLCAAAVADCSKNEQRHATTIVDRLALGMQLLDDMTDWEEDLQARNLTLPLTMAFRSEDIPTDVSYDRDSVLRRLLLNRALEKTLDLALSQLRETLRLADHASLGAKSGRPSLRFLRDILRNGSKANYIFGRAREHIILDPSKVDALRATERAIALVAQSS